MKFLAHINIMPKAELLDPQGKVVVKKPERSPRQGGERLQETARQRYYGELRLCSRSGVAY